MSQPHGAAEGYYQGGQQDIGMQDRGYQQSNQYAPSQGPPQGQYGYQQNQVQYPPAPQGQYIPPQQAPPNYGQPLPNEGKQTQTFSQDGKQDFNQAFSIPKQKWNDVWATILFLLVFAGFIVVSALALNGYSSTISGGGIYNNRNSFGLNSNTMILL